MTVEVCFYGNGYRKNPPYGEVYRPHFVIKGTSEYLGIQFIKLEEKPFDTKILCKIKTLYDGIDYSGLVSGISFEIKEGAHTVGDGIVVSS